MAPRTYVVGLPVVFTVHDDGTVTAEVDLSEASSAPWEDSGIRYVRVNDEWVEAEPYEEDVLIADSEAISAAAENNAITVS